MDYRAWYKMDIDPADYYAQVIEASPEDPKATARTRDAEGSIPGEAREKLFNISGEIKNWFNEYGAPMPPLMEGCTVLNLNCGSGRDAYLAAQLVGPQGHVMAMDPDQKILDIALKYMDREMKQFGYDEPNIEFSCGIPEDLSDIADESIDIVISNCTFNLSPDKERYISEVRRVLKDNGEAYFTDVFTDRRIPEERAKNLDMRALRLGGAMYINDFRRLVQANGFNDPRYPIIFRTPVSPSEQALFPDVAFSSLTVRLIKSSWTEDVCESYGETVTYKGNLADYPDMFLFDFNIKFPAGKTCAICGNVSGLAAHTRYAQAFEYTGNREQHIGDTHGDSIIKPAPEYSGVIDEDDQPIETSCC